MSATTTRTPGKGRTEGARRPRDTRERLLRSAATVLAANGYGQTRLDDIADLAGVRSPAVYYHFESRDDLVAATLRVGQQRVRDHVAAAIEAAAPDGWPAQLRAAVTAHLQIQLELSDFAKAVSRNAGHVPEPIRSQMHSESDTYHDMWRALLIQGRDSGHIDGGLDLSLARMLVIGALNWAAEWWTPGQPIEDLVRTACSIIDAGLRGSPPQH
ncbi:TetR/AcrR family transcriptional regulator [Gordonia sp. TBRC 11910]|uniref:TetR/AcrR family transcriptional regulator n=1 Tax=Gordonia asplenii TaxID=2725283 RepID=A0A848KTW1_9ACTN|nr:TetR/AcrR family transcriptional regulator [Gordonia asplenii]NMO01437.1 TetR/AcrR family transcriptional regulator [Gordonia asplenii]